MPALCSSSYGPVMKGCFSPQASCRRMGRARCQSVEVNETTTLPNVSRSKQLTLKIAAKNIPHPEKAHYGGEDAFFVSEIGAGAFGIADGVGGWADSGVNPADYSRTLMQTTKDFLEGSIDLAEGISETVAGVETRWMEQVREQLSSGEYEEELSTCVRTALAVAHGRTRLPGSSTACVVRLDPQQQLIKAANLGDSGFIIIRDGKTIFKTKPLEHFFDCPYQMGAYPEHTSATDTVDDAECYDVLVQAGDVIVAGTDGLWDNSYETELMQHLPKGPEEVEEAARVIAEMAAANSADPTYESPYTREAVNEGLDIPIWQKIFTSTVKDGKFQLGKLQGGKLDDITVLVAYVAEEELRAPEEDGVADSNGATGPRVVVMDGVEVVSDGLREQP